MTKYLWRGGKWIEASKAPLRQMFIQSDIETMQSPITGETIHTRSQYDRHLKAFGHHVSEPGDVGQKPRTDRGEIRAAVKESLRDLGVHR